MRVPDVERLWEGWKSTIIDPCAICGGAGFVLVGGSVEEPITKRCACRRDVERLAAMLWGNVPREFWRVEETEYTKGNVDHIERCRKLHLKRARAEGRGLVMVGECGVGKTTSACIVLSRAARRGFSVGYITAPELVMTEISAQSNPDLWAWREELLSADFLVLDEVGKEHRKEGSDYALSVLDALLRRRRGDMLPTILVTNMAWTDFKATYGESVWSIVADRSDVLQFRPGDHRTGIGL